ncbi:MAG TPA: PAS domain-containing protein [Ferrovibrio sp.]|uniref:PAS domain-containing protein n=1 Tax=Ferrovibrio sp. TaxID=1917215 RepID=UPI002ED03733
MFRPPPPLTATANPKADASWNLAPQTAAGLAAWSYWHGKTAPDGKLPCRDALDPVEMRSFLPTVFLADVVRGATRLRFRYRLAGTLVTNLAGREITGRMLDELFEPPVADLVGRAYAAVAKHRRPLQINAVTFWNEERVTVGVETLLFPLSRDGETVDMLFGVSQLDESDAGQP